jgi:hypothetical protein
MFRKLTFCGGCFDFRGIEAYGGGRLQDSSTDCRAVLVEL